MNDRIARLKSSKDARILAENARRLGDEELAKAAAQRAVELQALEEGFISPAERAIGEALIAYEEEMTRLRGRTFRANRTRSMLDRHSPLIAAERMVLTRRPSSGYVVLEEAGHRELSFEAIIDRFPDEFSEEAVEAARARLEGNDFRSIRPKPGSIDEEALNAVLVRAQELALQRFDASRNEVNDWRTSNGQLLDRSPKKSGIAFRSADNPQPAKKARNVSMKFGDRLALLEWMQSDPTSKPNFYVITQGGHSPGFPVDGLPYESNKAYASGRLRVVGVYKVDQADEAIEHYLRVLGEFAPTHDSGDSRARELTVDEISKGLLTAELDAKDRRWLIAHFYSESSTASMEEIARHFGYEQYRAGNSQYGLVAGRIAKNVQVDSSFLTDGPYQQQMQWIAVTTERNEEGHQQWRLRPAVCEALLGLGWVEQQQESPFEESIAPDLPSPEIGLSETEASQMQTIRRGQERFRKNVLSFWGDCCSVTGLRMVRLLVASHIKPWRDSTPSERLDGFNGLALSPNLDRLFDKGLVTFDSDGKMLVSSHLGDEARAALGIVPGMALRLLDSRIERYLCYHRESVFVA